MQQKYLHCEYPTETIHDYPNTGWTHPRWWKKKSQPSKDIYFARTHTSYPGPSYFKLISSYSACIQYS